jgi:hypothetical protein
LTAVVTAVMAVVVVVDKDTCGDGVRMAVIDDGDRWW